MSPRVRRIGALVLRYLLLIRRDQSRIIDLCYWPMIDIAIWGFLTYYFVAKTGTPLPGALAAFLGGAILWNLFLRAAQDVSVSFLDDVWARSLVTVFASPLTFGEFGVAIALVGATKVVMSLAVMAIAAWLLYAFDVFTIGWALVPFAANLMLFGWTMGLVALAVIVRFGGRWNIIAWSFPFLAMPVSSVFYPESVLPAPARAIARLVPANHVFEGMRAVVLEGRMPWDRVAIATALNLVYLELASALVAAVFRIALRRGLLPKLR